MLVIITGCTHRELFVEKGLFMQRTINPGDSFFITKTKDIKRNDLISFDYFDISVSKTFNISGRILGLPGDEVVIRNGQLYVNNLEFKLPATALFHYLIFLKSINPSVKNDLDIQDQNSDSSYSAFITDNDSLRYRKKYEDIIISMNKSILYGLNQKTLLRGKNNFGWDQDNFGPVKIPMPGSKMDLKTASIFINKIDNKLYLIFNSYLKNYFTTS